MPKVALIMGSKSDWPSLRGCVDVLKGFEIEVETYDELVELLDRWEESIPEKVM